MVARSFEARVEEVVAEEIDESPDSGADATIDGSAASDETDTDATGTDESGTQED